ncbi:MAG TPA: FHA domain-containing protein [Polyangiaceae bacterium]|nr:FHA domain-containing protein [Polyangiaceae bacterium]
MAVLESASTGARVTLGVESLVGRTSSCRLAINDPSVSREHARLRFHHGTWVVRDLNSKNGTFVNDRRLGAEAQPLAPGDALRFGRHPEAYRVVDLGEPVASAFARAKGERYRAEGGLLSLPPGREPPHAVVFRGPDRDWRAELEGRVVPVDDQTPIEIEGETFVLELPPSLDDDSTETIVDLRSLARIELEFRVSSDEEHVALRVGAPGLSKAFPHRAHHYLLLYLARQRLADRARGLPESNCGWVDAEQMLTDLRCDATVVNVQIHRARKQLADLGVSDAGNLVERRGGSRQLRLGVTALAVGPL